MAGLDPDLRARLLADPSALLDDREVMRALIAARDADIGDNVIDIRGRAMAALESRLDRLEAAHETVIAAAWDNQSGTATVHRAVLALLEPMDITGFIAGLQADVAPLLRVETMALAVEGTWPGLPGAVSLPPGAIGQVLAAGRRTPRGDDIVLRRADPVADPLHGGIAVASEALIPLDLGPGQPSALLVMGSADPARFTPAQGTDLLRFFAQAFRLALIGWLNR
ncbi:MAG: DUF484 family protein [Paracoccus sp. (in: a-proteobacteria)]|uniref:DUF484 family protein n=1 Tax=Paracoccus sp. TaxID=267 RepID=UPI0026DFFE96|nr:DUF484 family protein [Paracoccus sp. (in: a-proteobacteria)]MDO5612806.1 DUF484 family protein [Paracoccus sp. (in: a-proteobacteria)]